MEFELTQDWAPGHGLPTIEAGTVVGTIKLSPEAVEAKMTERQLCDGVGTGLFRGAGGDEPVEATPAPTRAPVQQSPALDVEDE